MKKMEVVLVGVIRASSRDPRAAATEVRKVAHTLGDLGIPIRSDYAGCHQAVAKEQGLVVAIQYPDDMPPDCAIALLREQVDSLLAPTDIRVYSRCGWNLTGADRHPELVCEVTTAGCAPLQPAAA